jgi:hypothetical protein
MKCADTRKARHGDKVTVHYGGFLQDGECRDTPYMHKEHDTKLREGTIG